MPTKIAPCLWFDDQAEAAAHYYVGIFKNSRITSISHYGHAGKEHHGKEAGSVLAVAFELNGQSFTALNGGPVFKFNEAISLQVECEDQAEIDYYWERLSVGGDPAAQQCGWVQDKYGLSWQVVPKIMPQLLTAGGPEAAERVMVEIFKMKKLDLAILERAYAG